MTARHERVKVADLRDSGAQARVEINEVTVADYAADMASGTVFPPVVAYSDGTDLWLADGFHRVRAAKAIDRDYLTQMDHYRDWQGKNRAGDDD